MTNTIPTVAGIPLKPADIWFDGDRTRGEAADSKKCRKFFAVSDVTDHDTFTVVRELSDGSYRVTPGIPTSIGGITSPDLKKKENGAYQGYFVHIP